MGRRLAIVVGVVAFLVVSLLVGRWLSTDGAERAKIERLLEAQGRADVDAMARELDGCDEACRARLRELTDRLARRGDLAIIRYDSKTARALGEETGFTRVVWQLPGTLPTVQCVRVRRTGDVLGGFRVTLLRLSAPIAREGACS